MEAITRQLDALGAVLSMLRRVEDPRKRARAIAAVRRGLSRTDRRLSAMARDVITQLREETPPASWTDIAELLGVTRQRVAQFMNTPATPERTTPE